MGKNFITFRFNEADSVRSLVKRDVNGNRNYDKAGRILVGMLNLFETGMTGVEMDAETRAVFAAISERLALEDIKAINEREKRNKPDRRRGNPGGKNGGR